MSSTKICKLSEVITIQNGYAFASKKFTTEEGMPLIRIRDLKNGVTTQTKYSGDYDQAYLVKSGDLLIGMDGEFKCYEWKGSPALLNQRVCRIQNINETFDLKYLYYGINSYLKAIEDVTGYTTVKHLSSSTVLNIEFPIPSLEKQRDIVKKLDSAFAEIDLLETNFGKSDEKANQLLQSLLRAAFTSSVSTKEPSNSAANPGLAMKNMKLGEAVDLFNGSTPLKTNKDYWVNGDIPWFTVDDLRKQGKFITYTEKFITKLGLKESSISLIPENAVLLCCTASVGAIAINKIRLTTNQQFNALVVKDTKKLLVEYLYYWFLSNMDILKSLGRATTIDYVSMTKLRDMNFQLPSLEKQRDIVEKLDSAFAEIESLRAKLKIEKELAAALRQSLLSCAFTKEEEVA